MAQQNRNTIKQWFETGDYPTQQQFWDFIDSVLFPGEVKINDVEGLVEVLQGKADANGGGSSALGEKITYNADGYFDIPASHLLEKVIVLYSLSGTLKIGTTEGGEEILPEVPWTANDVDPVVMEKLARTETRRIYFTGLPAGTVIVFFKKFINL